ncbi:MAG: InlB B-repeat-containing protein, partial [Paludibacteraceae bacterium]|nr:InlB B-repeat-containing protein [Paludibacteraceae bacterium]
MRYLKQFILTAILFLTGSISFAQDNLPVSGQIAGHDYVDLGLPSGTLWATYNVGATKPEQYGYYFAWGETEPKDVYNDWSTYKYATTIGEDLDSITKYNMSGRYGIIDSLSTLLPEDDAAAANWGSEWRMPTNEEQGELYENSYMVWTDGYNGTDVLGVIFYKAKSAEDKGEFVARWQTPSSDYSVSDDAHVFFPAAGSDVGLEGDYGFYWTSSLDGKSENYALRLYFDEEYVYWDYRSYRFSGFRVRAVANKTTDIEEYVVSFYTQDSVLIESQKVEKGKSATAVDAPVVDGYEFIGWSDSSFTNVTKDLDIYAQYKAITKDTLPVSGQIAGHDYIDLGLPSGTLWATYNVGATKPEQYGYYFAWGETEPKDVYNDWSTYKYATTIGEDLDSITKYNMSGRYGIIDSLSTLLPEDDAAAANWGSEWRMPTNEEQRELYENSYMVWTDDYNGTDVSGVIFYKAKEDSDKGQ